MRTAEAGLAGSGTLEVETRARTVAEAERVAERVGTVEKVVTPVRSVAVGFLLKPPLRF
jgi:hypothetical protein